MRPSKHSNRRGNGRFAALFAVLLFCAVLAVVIAGALRLSAQASSEGLAATRNAVERAAVLCYATEGFYPPGVKYIEQHYGVQIDHNRYTVRYEVFSPGITPSIVVVPKGQGTES